MPWQIAPGLIIIAGAFTVTGILLSLTDRLAYGKNRRVQIGEFEFSMDRRDAKIKLLKEKLKIEDDYNEAIVKREILKQSLKSSTE